MRTFIITLVLVFGMSTILIAEESDEIGALIQKSLAAEKSGKLEDALKQIEEAYRLEKKNYFVTLRAGYLNVKLKQFEEGVQWYLKARKLESKAIEPLLGLAGAYAGQENWAKAKYYYERGIRLDRDNYTAMIGLAYALYQQKQYRESYNTYNRLATLYPSDVTVQLGLAWCLISAKRPESAYKYALRAMRCSEDTTAAEEALTAIKTMMQLDESIKSTPMRGGRGRGPSRR